MFEKSNLNWPKLHRTNRLKQELVEQLLPQGGVLPSDFARDDLYSHENCLEDAALFGAWREAHGWGASAIINEPRMCLEYTKYMASYNVSGEVDLVDILSPADVA